MGKISASKRCMDPSDYVRPVHRLAVHFAFGIWSTFCREAALQLVVSMARAYVCVCLLFMVNGLL